MDGLVKVGGMGADGRRESSQSTKEKCVRTRRRAAMKALDIAVWR